jgi:hypothetical protein
MEAVDIEPATEKPVPVTVACEIVTAVVPELLRVRVCGLLDPVATLPKLKVAELAVSEPAAVPEPEVVFEPGVAAPVKPTQPERESSAPSARIRASRPSGARRLNVVGA